MQKLQDGLQVVKLVWSVPDLARGPTPGAPSRFYAPGIAFSLLDRAEL